jgi:hypothetical protein
VNTRTAHRRALKKHNDGKLLLRETRLQDLAAFGYCREKQCTLKEYHKTVFNSMKAGSNPYLCGSEKKRYGGTGPNVLFT